MAGLVDGTPIVTAGEVGEITSEPNLANLNDDASATIANACKWATSWLIDEIDSRGIPVATIANPERLKRAAALYAAHRFLLGTEPEDEAARGRSEKYLAEARDLVGKYRYVSTDLTRPDANLLLPELGNQDADRQFGPLPRHAARHPGWGPL